MFENIPVLEKIPETQITPEKTNEGLFEKVQTFFILSVMISWSCWMLLIASAKGIIPLKVDITGDIVGFSLFMIAMSGMFIAAVLLTDSGKRVSQLKEKLAFLGNWKKNLHWYPVAILIPIIVLLIAPGLNSMASGEPLGLNLAAINWLNVAILLLTGVFVAVMLMLSGPGYLLPMLEQADIGRSNASFIATGLTLAWLFPVVMLMAARFTGPSSNIYMIELIPLAVMLFWLYRTVRTDSTVTDSTVTDNTATNNVV